MKRDLIILLIVIITGLSALTNWSEISYRGFLSNRDGEVDIVTGATENAEEQVGSSFKSGINWKHDLSHTFKNGLNVNLENNLFWSQKTQEYRNSYFFNFGKLDVKYRSGRNYFKLQYSNRFYDHKETRLLNIPGVDHRTQQQMVHNTSLQYKGRWSRFAVEIYAAMRSLNYEYYIENLIDDKFKDDDDDDDDEDDIERENSRESDFYSQSKLSIEITDNWKIYTAVYYKNDLNKENLFNETRTIFGFEYFNRLDFFNIVKADFSYYKEDSKKLDPNQTDNFLTSLRYTKRIGTDLAGFVSLQNRSCYNKAEGKFLRISSLIKVRAKYTYLSSDFKDSFLQLGGKYNPENAGSLVFLELNQNITDKFYVNFISKYGPDLYTILGGRVEYFLDADKSFWIQEEYTDFQDWPAQHLISIGSTIVF